ncbi:TauD/TfdA family dioxygenase [Candidatus Peregrinibacteria bacterium]|nr:MAG: TauD/TfdA family dioxygenase [Candidatus Peregrinibacteria bacterium]
MEREIENLDLSKIPYKVEVVAPHLQKPGLKFSLQTTPGVTVLDLLREGILNTEIFERFGFVVIEDYKINVEVEEEEKPPIAFGELGDAYKCDEQGLHQDNVPVSIKEKPLITLRSADRGRISDTIVAVPNQELIKAMVDFINKLGPDEIKELSPDPLNIESFRNLIKDAGIELKPRDLSELIVKLLPFRTYTSYGNPELYRALNRAIEALLYRHKWKSHQLLIIDNQAMVHARSLPPELDTSEITEKSYLLRRIVTLEEGRGFRL